MTAPAVRLLLSDPGAALRLAREVARYWSGSGFREPRVTVVLTERGALTWGGFWHPAGLPLGHLARRTRPPGVAASGALLAGLADELIDAFRECGLTLTFPRRWTRDD